MTVGRAIRVGIAGIAGLCVVRRAVLLVALVCAAAPVAAQDRAATLADIRQEITVLQGMLDGLKRELSTTGGEMEAPAEGGPLVRLDAIEGELKRLVARTEELEFRIGRVIEDGTTRIGDLRFRLTELEGGDIGALGQTPTLGGGEGPAPQPPAPMLSEETQLAVGEQADFEAALQLAEAGDNAAALVALTRFTESYPRSPLGAEAQLYRGKVQSDLDDLPAAGRAYLDAYTLAEQSDPGIASEALLGLGQTLAALGQTGEACITLGQVGAAFPGTTAAERAAAALDGLDCS